MTVVTEPRHMTYHDVVRCVERFTYKPNVTIRVAEGTSAPIVHFTMYVPDSYRSWQPSVEPINEFDSFERIRLDRTILTSQRYKQDLDLIPVCGSREVPRSIHTDDRFWYWLRQSLLELETHELNEWFRVDGRLVYDPWRVPAE